MKRPIPQFRTGLEQAPITRDNLVQEIGSIGCARENDCRYQNPFEDRHHLIYSSYGSEVPLSEAEELLKSHPDFISNVCRCIHQRIHRTWNRSEPISDDFAVGYLLASPVNLTPSKRRQLKEIKRGLGK